MTPVIDVLLLLALPASGKTEVVRYLSELPPERAREDLHLGPLVEFHDYSYVHMMRRASRVLRALGHDGIFFDSDDLPMKDTRDWGTLVEMLNDDFDDQVHHRLVEPASAAAWLLDRYDDARERCGADPAFRRLPIDVRGKLVLALEAEAQELVALKNAAVTIPLEGRTVVIEMARGGPENFTPPLPAPLGYQYSLGRFSDEILSRASILYVRVTPEQSRRKATQRGGAAGDSDQSIHHHGVPLPVMLRDYGCDDMDHLIRTSGRPNAVRIEARDRTFMLPVSVFDNREDRTGFLRQDPAAWPAASLRALHDGLADALTRVVEAGAPMKYREAA